MPKTMASNRGQMLVYEGRWSPPSPRVHPTLPPCLQEPTLPDLTKHGCTEEDKPPLVQNINSKLRLLFDHNMHYNNRLRESTRKLQDDMSRNLKRYNYEKVKLQSQLASLRNELDKYHSKDLTSYQGLTELPIINAGYKGSKSADGLLSSGEGFVKEKHKENTASVIKTPKTGPFKANNLSELYSIDGSKISNQSSLKSSWSSLNSQSNFIPTEYKFYDGKTRRSSFVAVPPRYLPPLDTQSGVKQIHWQSGENLDPRFPKTSGQRPPVGTAIMEFNHTEKRVCFRRQPSTVSSEDFSFQSNDDVCTDGTSNESNACKSLDLNSNTSNKSETNGGKLSSTNGTKEHNLKQKSTDSGQTVQETDSTNKKGKNFKSKTQASPRDIKRMDRTELEFPGSKSAPGKTNSTDSFGSRKEIPVSTTKHQSQETVSLTRKSETQDLDFNRRSPNTLLVPAIDLQDVAKPERNASTKLNNIENRLDKQPHVRLPSVKNKKVHDVTKGKMAVNFVIPSIKVSNVDSGEESKSHNNSEAKNVSTTEGEKHGGLRLPSQGGELERLKTLLDIKNDKTILSSNRNAKKESPTTKWKSLYMRVADPKKRTQMLSDIVFAVRERMRDNEFQLRHGVYSSSPVTHNTLCDFLLFKPQKKMKQKPARKTQKLRPLPTHTAWRSTRKSTAAQLQECLRKNVKTRTMVEHLQAEEYRLLRYGKTDYFQTKKDEN